MECQVTIRRHTEKSDSLQFLKGQTKKTSYQTNMISIHAQKFALLDAENNETLENILKAPHKKYHAITCLKLGGKLY